MLLFFCFVLLCFVFVCFVCVVCVVFFFLGGGVNINIDTECVLAVGGIYERKRELKNKTKQTKKQKKKTYIEVIMSALCIGF